MRRSRTFIVNKVSISTVEYVNVIHSMRSGIENLSPSIREIDTVPRSAPTMREYRRRLNDISQILTQLQQLLNQDLEKMQAIETELIGTDKRIARASSQLTGSGKAGSR